MNWRVGWGDGELVGGMGDRLGGIGFYCFICCFGALLVMLCRKQQARVAPIKLQHCDSLSS